MADAQPILASACMKELLLNASKRVRIRLRRRRARGTTADTTHTADLMRRANIMGIACCFTTVPHLMLGTKTDGSTWAMCRTASHVRFSFPWHYYLLQT